MPIAAVPVPMPSFDSLIANGGPFVAVALAFMVMGVVLWKIVGRPLMSSIVEFSRNMAQSAALSQQAANDSRIASEQHVRTQEITSGNLALLDKMIDKLIACSKEPAP